ncbi:MAG: hypothetical protein FWF46_07470, partial [Oscillospiraceae bacterium]|nr:hypothetical protein [Oscillospiraceae bacterium]
MQKNFSQRKPIRLKEYDYSTPGHYFITICIKNRISLLGIISESKIKLSNEGIIVNRYISSISEIYHNVQIDEYIIMPNHIHILINIKEQGKFTISNIIQ